MITAAPLLALLAAPSFAAVEGEQPGKVMPDMTEGAMPPKHLQIPAVPEGQNLKPVKQHPMLHKEVINTKGEQIGKIEKLLSSKEGRIEYAEVALAESGKLVPIPWKAFQVDGESVIINASKEQLQKEGPTFQSEQSGDFEHKGGEPLKPNLRQGGG
jgi:sporulation protein YlmC with PRC-barrel domain